MCWHKSTLLTQIYPLQKVEAEFGHDMPPQRKVQDLVRVEFRQLAVEWQRWWFPWHFIGRYLGNCRFVCLRDMTFHNHISTCLRQWGSIAWWWLHFNLTYSLLQLVFTLPSSTFKTSFQNLFYRPFQDSLSTWKKIRLGTQKSVQNRLRWIYEGSHHCCKALGRNRVLAALDFVYIFLFLFLFQGGGVVTCYQ